MLSRFVAYLCLTILAAACPKPSAAPEADASVAEFAAGKFSRSAVCKQCHVDIYQFWSVSAHATSYRNRNFQVAQQQFRKDAKPADADLCVGCHAPLMRMAASQSQYKEWKPSSTLEDEGIGCDFCHSITAVDLTNAASPYTLDPGPIKYGPVQDATDQEHGVAYAELFTQSAICAGCHEYTKPGSALSIISTYSEWQKSEHASKGEHCQSCHMKVEPGTIVDPKVKRSNRPVNAHRMPGSHSRALLRDALRLRIDDLKQNGDKVDVTVVVENKGGGHAIPTGMPTRRLELEVEAATPSGRSFKERRVYQKQLVDDKGLTIVSDSQAFLTAVAILEDNRIGAGEARRESFSFAVPHDEQLTVRAHLTYSYSPQPDNLPEERLGILSVEKSLAAR